MYPADLLRYLRQRWQRRGKPEEPFRTLVSNLPFEGLRKKEQPNRSYADNSIKTSKYTVWSFIPINLFEQFHRLANIYFVGIAALNFVPIVNAFQPGVAVIPICVILCLTAVKDAWEDFRRYQADKQLNNMPCRIYSSKLKDFSLKCWKDVRVGDFVKVVCNEVIPADIVLLYSSDPNGICNIETASLDGETNLKQRLVVRGVFPSNKIFEPESFQGTVVCEKPNNKLNHFKGYLDTLEKKRIGFGKESLLLRGCTVRNTDEAAGIVVYAGHETKAMLNNNGPRYKRSKLERKMNMDVLFCVVLLIIMCLTGALGYYIWLGTFAENPPFVIPDSNMNYLSPSLSGFYMFFTMIILLQVLIPISLYVSIEMIKVGQVFFITNDVDLYDEKTDKRVLCRALNITEDLGQIRYVFSDKTGTLTENKMVFRRCSIMGTEYCHKENALRLAAHCEPDSDDEDADPRERRVPSRLHRYGRRSNNSAVRRSQSTRSYLSAYRSDDFAVNRSNEMAFCSPLEKDIAPDRKLLHFLRQGGSQLDVWYRVSHCHGGPCCLDFFLALTTCNSVVVSTAATHRERLNGSLLFPTKLKPIGPLHTLLKKVGSLSHIIHSLQTISEKNGHSGQVTPALSGSSVKEEDEEEDKGSGDSSSQDGESGQGEDAESEMRDGRAPRDADELCYEAESPDEAALVHAARAYGFTLLARTPSHVVVRLPQGTIISFEVLDTLAFDSTRKRMSVLVRHPLTNQVIVYTKGADSTIMELLASPTESRTEANKRQKIVTKTKKHLRRYAEDGLRTLCIAKRILSEEEYEDWSSGRQEAEAAIDNKDELLAETAASLERNLTLLGATGIEDRLQEDVPATIAALREAGIQVWVLTGDKQETAVNIAYSCKLLEKEDVVFTINTDSKEECDSILEYTLEDVRRYSSPVQPGCFRFIRDAVRLHHSSGPTFGLVIDGSTLGLVLENSLKLKFLELARHCRSVLCCRVTPLQKSLVVKLARDKLKVMTLSIGDGANDVNMIQAADIGVGISGQEGMQAVMASDFAITQFKHLKKLLLVHGHWCYSRLANMIVYFFYKNVTYVNLLFWYQFYCGFSGTAMIDYWLMIFFNLFFTSTPPIMFGIMDRDISAETLMAVPELYKTGQNSEGYKRSTFWITMLDAFYQSLVCFFVPYWTYSGSDIDVYSFGTPMNTASFFTIILHLAIEIRNWTTVHWIIMVGSVVLYFVVSLAFTAICVTCNPPSNPYWIMQDQMCDPMFYLTVILATVVALLPRYVTRVLQGTLAYSSLVWARQLDRLPPEKRDALINERRGQNVPTDTHYDLSSPEPTQNPIETRPGSVAKVELASEQDKGTQRKPFVPGHQRSISTMTI